MKKIYIYLMFGTLFLMKAQGQIITASLQTELNNAASSDMLHVIIKMTDQLDCDSLLDSLLYSTQNLTRNERRQLVVNELKSFAYTSQQEIMNTITSLETLGQVDNLRQFWIINMIACKAKPAAIIQLAQRQDVSMIHIDEIYEFDDLEATVTIPQVTQGIPYQIDSLYVPEVWEMGYQGEEVVVAVLDTGVDYYHPDLEDSMWTNPVDSTYGYNFIDENEDPMDNEGHGTLVAGIIAGKGKMGIKTGVAPKAKIMALKVGYSGMHHSTFHSFFLAGIAWGLEKGADIFNISWENRNTNSVETYGLWRQVMDCVLEASCVTVVAAGNSRVPSAPNQIQIPGKIPPPWKHPHQIMWGSEGGQSSVVCVGAIDSIGEVWSNSSRGPVTWSNVPPYNDYPYNLQNEVFGLRRPDVVAPGVAITSLQANSTSTGYVIGTGTSLSAPAVAGVLALMLSKNPFLTPVDLDSIIEMTAFHPEDPPGFPEWYVKDNVIGAGKVKANLAVLAVPECDLIIEGNEVLNDTIFYCDIVVKPGGTLTINQNLWFARDRKIIVEQGGKLIVNGAVISRLNNRVWQGIEVWGNSTTHQFPDANGNYSQGYLNLNNATIENAITAVSLWKPGQYSTTGGIVIAKNTIFRNNRIAVHALHYTNLHPFTGLEMDNIASFKQCSFVIDENYPGVEIFYKHVDLSKVKGVKFSACDFSLAPDASNVSVWNAGIAAFSAGFSVDAICTSGTIPCNSYDHSTFTGFLKAIDVNLTAPTTRTFYVSRAQFNDNTYGIHVNGINNFVVKQSDFNLGKNDAEEEECEGINTYASAYGIHMTGCTGFAIEENYFTKASGAPTGNYTGIYIAETHAADQVYKNTFDGLSYGNYAVGINWFENYFKGLAYYCNENSGNFADFFVEPDNDELKISGIQSKQGDYNFVTGNTFTSTGNTWHFYNGGDYLVGYYYCNYCDNESPDETKIFQVTDKPKTFSNNCPSHYGGGGGSTEQSIVLATSEKQEAELEFAVNLSNYNGVKTLYDDLKDGGNTDAVIADIQNAWPTDTWELRDELLGKSPHLSMEVLKAAADKTDVLPESIIFEVLAANPDELKKEELIKYLEDKADPLPGYMVNILRHLANGTTYKTILEQHMAHYNQVKTRAAYDIVRSLLNDTIMDFEQLRNWLDNVGGKRADEQIIATYLAENNYTNALVLANMMPSLYAYSGDKLTEHGYYMDLLNLQINLEQHQRSIFDLDSLELANLIFIAENSQGTAGLQAKGILEYAYGYHFCNCLNISDMSGYKQSRFTSPEDLAKLHGVEINAHPNPASQWVAFNYALPANAYQGEIKIVDAKGAAITSFTVTGAQGQQVWDTRSIKPGVYFYTLSVGEFTKTGKIVINR